jgi:hypothetical protein
MYNCFGECWCWDSFLMPDPNHLPNYGHPNFSRGMENMPEFGELIQSNATFTFIHSFIHFIPFTQRNNHTVNFNCFKMPVTLYGSPQAACTRGILHFLEENPHINVEFKAVDFAKAENRSPEYLKINPFGKIPSLVDDDFVLLESSAIIK